MDQDETDTLLVDDDGGMLPARGQESEGVDRVPIPWCSQYLHGQGFMAPTRLMVTETIRVIFSDMNHSEVDRNALKQSR